MSLRDSPFGDLKVPLRWTAAAALVVAVGAALFLLFTNRPDNASGQAMASLRHAADSVVGPVGDVLSAPIRWARSGADGVSDYIFAAKQNRYLKRQLMQAQRWRDQALALAEDNGRLRALAGVATDPPIAMVLARTVIDARGPFANTRLANAGANRGVTEGNPALSEHGLVGRVIGVSPTMSRIMLLTDPESRTPVLLERTNARAILTGDGGPNPQLAYLRTTEPVRDGDRVMTSGDGGVFPRGLPIGIAAKGADGAWRTVLDADATPIDYVQILLFRDFSQLVPSGGLAPDRLPTAVTENSTATILGSRTATVAPAPAAKVVAPAKEGKAKAARAPKPRPAEKIAAGSAIRPPKAAPALGSPQAQNRKSTPVKSAAKTPASQRPPVTIGDLLDQP